MSVKQALVAGLACGIIGAGIGWGVGSNHVDSQTWEAQPDISAQMADINLDSAYLPIAGNPVRGSQNPIATVVVFTDYKSPATQTLYGKIFDKVFAQYGDKVAVVYKAFPLQQHQDALLRAQAAAAAHKQGKFWEMSDQLLTTGGSRRLFTEAEAIAMATKIGLNLEQFKTDLNSAEIRESIRKDIALGEKLGVNRTPAIFINNKDMNLKGLLTEEVFLKALTGEMNRHAQFLADLNKPGRSYYLTSLYNAPKLVQEAPKIKAETLQAANKRPNPNERKTPRGKAVPQAPEGKVFVDISGAPTMGDPNAPITLVEFTDFECPFCARANNTVKTLMEKNPGKIKVVFKHNPLSFHKNADAAHRAAEAAGLQGKFWEMSQKLFDNQKALTMPDIEKYAAELGLDVAKLKADMENELIKNRVAADLSQGKSVTVQGTPHFFMNGTRIKGAQPLESFQAALDKELAIADKYIKRGVAADALYKTIIAEEPKPKATPKAPEAPAAPIVLTKGDSYAKGPENAPVTIYQFSEFQCPFCARVEPTVDQIMATYGDKVRIIFKNMPLAFHKDAPLAAEAAFAAGTQGKFWEMHKILFANNKNLKREALEEYAKQIGLNMDQFKADLDSQKFKAQVDKEAAEGKGAGLSGTPSFVINGKKFVGAQPFENFKKEIDAALAAAAK